MTEARHFSPSYGQVTPPQSVLSCYLAATRSHSSIATRSCSRGALLTSSSRKPSARHKFPGLKPKKGKTPVKRTVETRKNSISVTGLPPGLATMLVADGKSKDVSGQTFHYPTMLMLRILRKGNRSDTRRPSLHREKSTHLSRVQLELDCEVRAAPVLRSRSVPRPRYSLDSRPRVPSHKLISSPLPIAPSIDGKDSTPIEPEEKPVEKTTRKTIFMRKEGCVCYSIPSLQNNRE